MAKLKHHTNRNVTAKAHKNSGLKKKSREFHTSQKGMDPKYLRNLRFARKPLLAKKKQEKRARNVPVADKKEKTPAAST